MVAGIGRAAGVLALLAAPVAAHLSLATGRATLLVGILVTLQAAMVCWVLLSLIGNAVVRRVAFALVVAAVALAWLGMRDSVPVLSAIPHAMCHAGLLALFAASLAPGREAIITRVARQVRGPLPDNVLRYTRRVTLAWCVFFAAQLLTSLLLFLFAPVAIWSMFVNLLNLPLILAMFGAEYLYRQLHYPLQSHDRAGAFLRMVGAIKSAAAQHGR